MNYEAERQAAQIRIRAERKCGEFLAEDANKAKAGPPVKNNRSQDATNYRGAPTLEERGITKRQSSDWQKLAQGRPKTVPDQNGFFIGHPPPLVNAFEKLPCLSLT
jgi:hypothetical protein